MLDDAYILVSLLLQNGVEPAALARTVGRLGDGKSPASVIGALPEQLLAGSGRFSGKPGTKTTPIGRSDPSGAWPTGSNARPPAPRVRCWRGLTIC